MTDLHIGRRPQPPSDSGGPGSTIAGGAPSPSADRLARPRWRDGRLIAGVLLVLVAVLIGARVLSSADHTAPVLVAARPLGAGHVLAAEDLSVVRVRLGDASRRYWPAADLDGLRGHPLTVAVATGDLLARSAVADGADPEPLRVVSLPVDPTRLPAIHAGDRVDVFATYRAAGTAPGLTRAVVRGVEYVGGGDTGSGSTVAIRLRVPVAAAGSLVRASEVASLDVVLQLPAGTDSGDVGAAPLTDGPGPTAAPSSSAPAARRR